jgi:hypothetical protein
MQTELEQFYIDGVGQEMYAQRLSPDFDGMPFADVVELCFTRLGIVLFGIKTTDHDAKATVSGRVILNPGQQYMVREGDEGFFVADSAETAAR